MKIISRGTMKLNILFLSFILVSCATTPKASKLTQMVCSDLNSGEAFKYEVHYSNDFQKALPESQLAGIYDQVKKGYGACVEVIDFSRTAQSEKFSFKHESGKIVDLTLVEKNGVIEGLRILGERPDPVTYSNWKEVQKDFEKYSDARLLVKIDNKNVVRLNELKRTPTGSIFKIFILDALSEEIKKGKYAWDHDLEINELYKSLPSGTMQNEEAGEKFSLLHYATQMISISDNTATDHLFNLLGRSTIEKRIKARGLTKTFGWSRPFLNTMEFFKARAFFEASQYRDYARASRNERQLMIQKVANRKEGFETAINSWQEPRGIYDTEWFSNPKEVCDLLGKMSKENDPSVIKAMSKNVPFIDDEVFSQSLYKGGSEPGVLQMAFHFILDEKPVCLYAGVSDRANPVDERVFMGKIKGAISYLQSLKASSE